MRHVDYNEATLLEIIIFLVDTPTLTRAFVTCALSLSTISYSSIDANNHRAIFYSEYCHHWTIKMVNKYF